VEISNGRPRSPPDATAEVGVAGNFAAVIGDIATSGPLPDSLRRKMA
jgi:hypothetical protein